MSAHAQQIILFPAAARAKARIRSAETVPYDTLPDRADRIPLAGPFNTRLPVSMPACRWSEGLAGLGAALALHLAWLAVAPSEKPTPMTPPAPIQVQWIASSQPRAEPPKPVPPKAQAIRKPAPKTKPRKPAAVKPKPLLSTPDSASEMTVAEKAEAPKTPVEASPPPAPAPAPAPVKNAPAEAAPLVLPNLNADYLDNPAPNYPRISRELGEQGKVLLRALINTDGTVAQLMVHKTSGFSRLDQSALKTVKSWRFVPARRGGQIVQAWVVVPVSFTLEE
jgi:protein TonB